MWNLISYSVGSLSQEQRIAYFNNPCVVVYCSWSWIRPKNKDLFPVPDRPYVFKANPKFVSAIIKKERTRNDWSHPKNEYFSSFFLDPKNATSVPPKKYCWKFRLSTTEGPDIPKFLICSPVTGKKQQLFVVLNIQIV